jgi:uncharacterized membrane protein YbhN (UPF0104 family)
METGQSLAAPRGKGRWARLRAVIPLLTLAVTVTLLLIALDPAHIWQALRHFSPALFVPIILLARVYFGVQAVRWNFLLRSVGIRVSQWETQFTLLAAQIASLLPFGQYARAVFAAEATGAEAGTVTATVAVQEITYALVLLLIAVPGSISHPAAAVTLLTSLATTVTLIVVLVWPPVYRLAGVVLRRLPWSEHTVPALAGLYAASSRLLVLPATLWGTSLTVLYGALYVTLLWVVAEGVHPGVLSWEDAAFVCAISHFAGAVTTLPGGIGGYEAVLIGLLVAVGVDPADAGAITILFTVADRGIGTLLGIGPYFIFQRRYAHAPRPAQ